MFPSLTPNNIPILPKASPLPFDLNIANATSNCNSGSLCLFLDKFLNNSLSSILYECFALSYPLSPLHPPAKNTRSQRNPAVLTPTARVPIDNTPSVHQLSANLDRGPPMEGAAPSRKGGMKSRRSRSFSGLLGGYPGMSEGVRARIGEVEDEEGGVCGRGRFWGGVADVLANVPEVPQGSNQTLFSQSDQSLLKIMEQMATIMGQISQEASPRDNSKAPAFKTPSMKAPDTFDVTQAHKLRGFVQSCQLIFHNDPANFFSARKKVLY
ncbi:hypothetical protein O181_036724 [Austropuccinia psidii MF-1]|uniref:Uncharacterized protein n=1 Tax=Austropuccinia psidii MF-1 TaxID=1389203 RepID=A0A9Q3D573_9BASI|nr:hypothetical protein [Austropuccinia psidii MF-1]